jgi:hypothetical protein
MTIVRSVRGLVLAVGVATLLLLARLAFAVEFVTLEDQCNGRQLMVTGTIEPGDAARVEAALARLVLSADLPDVQDAERLWTVRLDSPGGDLYEGMRIGRLLRAAYATTEVSYRFARRSDGVYDFARGTEELCVEGVGRLAGCKPDVVKAGCAGACLLAWLGGADRYAHEGDLGTHGLPESGPAAAAVAQYLTEMGVDADGLSLLHAPGADVRWLPWAERTRLDGRAPALRDALAACPPPLDQQESFDSVMHPDAAVRDPLMHRAAKHRACRLAVIERARASLFAELRSHVARR